MPSQPHSAPLRQRRLRDEMNPTQIATACGLNWHGVGEGDNRTLTWEDLMDLLGAAYERNAAAARDSAAA